MQRLTCASLIAVVVAASPRCVLAQPPASRQPAATAAPRVQVCALLPKEEVKKHLPWKSMLDQFPIEEEAIGATGSSCNYPSVTLQVFPYSQQTIDMARKKGGLETIGGVGDEAYFHNNADRYAELYVRVGKQLLTLQASADGKIDAVKAGVLDLAKALVARLR